MVVTEIQQAMLLSPGLAVENTMKGNFQPTSILHSAEARRREASWEDCFLTGWGWLAQLCRNTGHACNWFSNPGVSARLSANHFRHFQRLGDALLPFPDNNLSAGTKSPRCQDGCRVKMPNRPLSTS